MIADDIIYLSLLLVSIGFGPVIRKISNVKLRQLLSTVTGILLVAMVSGVHIIHPLILTVINAFIVCFASKKSCHVISFIFCFAYLVFFRITHYFGLPSPPPHTNAVQMILTLKMVGLAFEVHNNFMMSIHPEKKDTPEYLYQRINPSFFDVIQYSFCFAGVLIGPYYKFRTYWDMLHSPYIPYVPCTVLMKQRICMVPIYLIMFLVSNYIFPLEYASSNEILKDCLWYRVFYMTPLFFNFRMRIYTGFILGECVCIMAGLGAYPSSSLPQPGAGPTNYAALKEIENNPKKLSCAEYSFETVRNIYEYGSEFLPTIQEGIRSWNRTVQYWLAVFVYRQLPFPKPARIAITMLVSSFWHGVHPGYYLCLLSAPVFLVAEGEVVKAVYKGAPRIQQMIFQWVWWFIKMQSFSYMGMAFLLLYINNTLHYWSSIYFIGHIFIIITYVLAFSINKRNANRKEKSC